MGLSIGHFMGMLSGSTRSTLHPSRGAPWKNLKVQGKDLVGTDCQLGHTVVAVSLEAVCHLQPGRSVAAIVWGQHLQASSPYEKNVSAIGYVCLTIGIAGALENSRRNYERF